MRKKWRVAFVTNWDSASPLSWSGIPHHFLQKLKQRMDVVQVVDNLIPPLNYYFKVKNKIYQRILKRNYIHHYEPLILKSYARQIVRRIKEVNVDFIISINTLPIAYLDTKIPILFWADATFAGLLNFYSYYTDLPRQLISSGHAMENHALDRALFAIYSSEWAVKTAKDNYDFDESKLKILSFGPSLIGDMSWEEIKQSLKNKDTKTCRLVCIITEWHRKGGDVSLAIHKKLTELGFKSELTIIGDVRKKSLMEDLSVTYVPYLNRNLEQDRNLFKKIMLEAHFFLMPTQADTTPVSISESYMFGVPSVTSDVGGLSSCVINGITGRMISPYDDIDQYCQFIISSYEDKQRYYQLSEASYDQYQTKLNYDVSIKRLLEIL